MIPVLLKSILPSEQLQEYVRKYQIFRFIFDKEVTPPIKFHLPGPVHCITFYPRDVQRFRHLNSIAIQTYPRCVINGIYTIPIYRYGGNDFLAIKVVLQPSVLYKMIKHPVSELTNKFINAEDVWGNEVHSVCERLNELDDLAQMIMVIEKFIENQIKKIDNCCHPIDKVPRIYFEY